MFQFVLINYFLVKIRRENNGTGKIEILNSSDQRCSDQRGLAVFFKEFVGLPNRSSMNVIKKAQKCFHGIKQYLEVL